MVACLPHKEKNNVGRKAARQTVAGPAHAVALRRGRSAGGAARRYRRAGAAVSRCSARDRFLGISDLQDGVGRAAVAGAPRKLKLSWNAGAVCLAPVPVAIDYGFFQKQNLDVELVNYSGSTDQLLEAIATGKSDAGLGMALRWLKPLEQGFDVKIAAGTHGGCMRVLTRTSSGVEKLADLKGKIVAVGDLAGPDKNFFSIQLAKLGIDPNKDVDWRPIPGNLLNLAVEKGEVQAFLASDPLAHLWLKDTQYKEVASNLDGEYRDKSCCILGAARQPGARTSRRSPARSRRRCSMPRCSPRRIRTRPRNRSSPMRQRRRRWPISKRWRATTPITIIPSATCSSAS